jgi:hypothetical protein
MESAISFAAKLISVAMMGAFLFYTIWYILLFTVPFMILIVHELFGWDKLLKPLRQLCSFSCLCSGRCSFGDRANLDAERNETVEALGG